MSSYRGLLVWQKAIELVDDVYAAVRTFPREETFGLSQQMRRAATAIPCNIAEGNGRGRDAEYRYFVRVALGSALELQTEIVIAARQRFFDEEVATRLDAKAEEVGKLLNRLLRSITTNDQRRTTSA